MGKSIKTLTHMSVLNALKRLKLNVFGDLHSKRQKC